MRTLAVRRVRHARLAFVAALAVIFGSLGVFVAAFFMPLLWGFVTVGVLALVGYTLHTGAKRWVQALGGPFMPVRLTLLPFPADRESQRMAKPLHRAGFQEVGSFRPAEAPAVRVLGLVAEDGSAYAVVFRSLPFRPQVACFQLQGDGYVFQVGTGDPHDLPVVEPNRGFVVVPSEATEEIFATFRQHAAAHPTYRHTAEAFTSDFATLWEREMRWWYTEGPDRDKDPDKPDLTGAKPDPYTAQVMREKRALE